MMMETQRAIDIIFNMMPEDEEEAEALSLAVSALRERLLAEQHNEQKMIEGSITTKRTGSKRTPAITPNHFFDALAVASTAP